MKLSRGGRAYSKCRPPVRVSHTDEWYLDFPKAVEAHAERRVVRALERNQWLECFERLLRDEEI